MFLDFGVKEVSLDLGVNEVFLDFGVKEVFLDLGVKEVLPFLFFPLWIARNLTRTCEGTALCLM